MFARSIERADMCTQDGTSPSSPTAAQVAAGPPPLRARSLLVGAAIALTVLVISVLMLVPRPGPQDESSFANQRKGLLANGPRMPAALAGIGFDGHLTVLLFVRRLSSSVRVARWHAREPGSWCRARRECGG